ncbi:MULTISPECIES: PadR family transcriptional regulator [Streptomyces]|uniref:PadR family transcriptional regulator n=1 Tax=Streptomyces tirandamycinicus TaxID=2174846 RepID=A0A2S1SMD6_9ACTN|nr:MULTISPECIES: PadR family transcriptional regulator [Streptomyces]AWI27516.1 PadR family transcriptional regulator [Streptomyces tirandamycinicus]MCY0981119.1 PadR family transcriptional regulator [Streptomyces tirandamycinicus]NNJ05361.1 PadR family transcriptional regulator [Streptomyces sp. PKU-MA01144]RNL70153.1 PadR family transcriptional regulator [Streptomyces sp. I6]TFE39093.1 PadR family transcriptional regulator [Streptomyces sp. ICN441]
MRLPLLALLSRGPAHGYELKQDLEQLLGAAYPQPNVGQIYVTLGRLEKSGLIEGEEVAQSSRPNKKIYRLTDAGTEALRAWFEETADEPRVRDEFFMKLALAPRTGLADQIALINKQRREYLNTMRNLSKLSATEDRDNRIAQLLIEGAMLHLQADLDWLERCQEELEGLE